MAGTLGAMLGMARQNNRARSAAVRLVTGLAIAALSACNTGDVFSLQPAVDVGSQTAAVPEAPQYSAPQYSAPQYSAPQYSGMQRLVPSDPYMTAAYPRMDEPMSPAEQVPELSLIHISEPTRPY